MLPFFSSLFYFCTIFEHFFISPAALTGHKAEIGLRMPLRNAARTGYLWSQIKGQS
jgi:hypothetical protein